MRELGMRPSVIMTTHKGKMTTIMALYSSIRASSVEGKPSKQMFITLKKREAKIRIPKKLPQTALLVRAYTYVFQNFNILY
jgi:hypothetical protein